MPEIIRPDWPAPVHVHALTTTRTGGVSLPPFDAFNLASHVGDDPVHVEQNRLQLQQSLQLPSEPVWLSQVHGVVMINAERCGKNAEGDGSFATRPGKVCAVLTADCLPLLLTDKAGSCVAAVHAGWRGLAAGIIEAAVAALPATNDQLMAWLGPAIGPAAFEVGDEVRESFCAVDDQAENAFTPQGGKWLADIYLLARQRLTRLGVRDVYGGGFCTYQDKQRFYSYRRDGQTGRMASLIWLS